MITLNRDYVSAISFGKSENDTITAFFNAEMLHAAPLSLNLIHNAIVRAYFDDNHSITVINEPLKYTTQSQIVLIRLGTSFGYILSALLGFAMSFVSGFYVMSIVKVVCIHSAILLRFYFRIVCCRNVKSKPNFFST